MTFGNFLLESSAQRQLSVKYPGVISQVIGPRPPEDGENGYYILSMIVVPYKERGQQIATRYMQEFIRLAKKEQNDIFLTVSAEYQEPGEMTHKDIENWYKKLGFVKKHKDDFRSQNTMCYYS